MLGKNKKKKPTNRTVVMDPNKERVNPYELREDVGSDDLQGDELERLQAQIKKIEEEKQKLLSAKEKEEEKVEVEDQQDPEEDQSEPVETETVSTCPQAYVIKADLVGKGVFHYLVETNYPLGIGPCELKQ